MTNKARCKEERKVKRYERLDRVFKQTWSIIKFVLVPVIVRAPATVTMVL